MSASYTINKQKRSGVTRKVIPNTASLLEEKNQNGILPTRIDPISPLRKQQERITIPTTGGEDVKKA